MPAGQPVLFCDDYGFHYGDVWYRGSWTAAPDAGATSVNLTYQTGQVGMLLAWLDGQFLGSHQMPTPTSSQSTQQGWTATVPLAIPAPAQAAGPHVLAVLVRPMSHQEDGGANDAFKQALGLIAVTFTGAAPAVRWRVQGAANEASGAAASSARSPSTLPCPLPAPPRPPPSSHPPHWNPPPPSPST